MIEKVLSEPNGKKAMFSGEIWNQGRRNRPDLTWSAVKTALGKMVKHGDVSRFDEQHQGWKFARGYLYALPGKEDMFAKRIESLDEQVTTRHERLFIVSVKGGLWLASELRRRTRIQPDWIWYMARKFGRSTPIKARAEGEGYNYHIEVFNDPDSLTMGKGLFTWLRWTTLFGQLVVYDDRRVSQSQLREFLARAGYWLSQEGKRRQAVGREWEDYSNDFFRLCDKTRSWRLRVAEHRQNFRGRSGREFDHVYTCTLGPDELDLDLTIVFECKAGMITSNDVDEFYRALANEPEFRNHQMDGIKSNLRPVMLSGQTAEKAAFEKAARIGIKIILHTSLEDTIARLMGRPRKTFRKILAESGLIARNTKLKRMSENNQPLNQAQPLPPPQ